MYAVSHGLQSEPHTSFQAVPPLPPLEVGVVGVVGTNVSLAWRPPQDSLYTEFILRYRPQDEEAAEWTEVSVSGEAGGTTLQEMLPGHQFSLQLDTASFNVPSGRPVTTLTTTAPAPINIDTLDPVLDAENVNIFYVTIRYFPN